MYCKTIYLYSRLARKQKHDLSQNQQDARRMDNYGLHIQNTIKQYHGPNGIGLLMNCLGIELIHNLGWNTHIPNTTSKANQTSMVKECLISVQLQAYKAIVKPIVEYASAVWDPHHQQVIKTI